MIVGLADTHTALWYIFGDPRLSSTARQFLDDAVRTRRQIAISAITLVEVVYLVEKRRVPASAYDELWQTIQDPEHIFAEAVFTSAIAQILKRISRTDVPDMPDRMIAATAVHLGIPILSRDRRIQAANLNTIW